MYSIKICSVKQLCLIAGDADLHECAAIVASSYEIPTNKLHGLGKLLALSFDDVLDTRHPHAFNTVHADQIKSFVDSLPDSLDTLFVCCDGGESRSAAMAVAIMKYKGLDETAILNNPKYRPNALVYRILCDCL